jgi:hypothetical protein
MSVSSECKHGDSIYIIESFIEPTIDKNGLLDMQNSIEHKVGEKVIYLNWYYKNIGDNQGIFIKFQDETKGIFSAAETYFVTEDVWNGLRDYFKLQ